MSVLQGFYTRAEAATVLGVSHTTISQYVKDGKVRSTTIGRTTLIPQEDIIHFYSYKDKPPTVMRHEFEELKKMFEGQQTELNVLKVALGIRHRRAEWTDTRIRFFYSKVITDIGMASWETTRIYEYADELLSMSNKELARLLVLMSSDAWKVIYDLASRMMVYIKNLPAFPSSGLETLLFRIEGGRDKLCGHIHIALNKEHAIKYQAAHKLQGEVEKKPLDIYLYHYLKERRKQYYDPPKRKSTKSGET